jgi:hypothetical protein
VLRFAYFLFRLLQFLLKIIRAGASSKPSRDAQLAFECLILLTLAEGSILRNIQLALVVTAHPSLVEVKHLETMQQFSKGVTSGESESSLRAKDFSLAVRMAVQEGHACTCVQACAAVMAQVELLVSEAELTRKHRSKASVPSVSEIDALRLLLDFIDLLGGSYEELEMLAWEVLVLGPGLQQVREKAERAHSTRCAVQSSAVASEYEKRLDDRLSDGLGKAIIFNVAMRLIAANLALSIHVDDALEVDPVQNLERARGLLRAVVSSGADSKYFSMLSSEERKEVFELALDAYEVGGEAFFKDAAVMTGTAKDILQRALGAPSTNDEDPINIAVLKIFSRQSVLLPLLLSTDEDIRRRMLEVVDIVSELRFRELGQNSVLPDEDAAQSSNLETIDADWDWGLCHRESIELSKNNRRVYKSNGNPDYSCAMSSEAFVDGVHAWEILFEATGSTWVGIAGESTKDYLGSSPGIEYGATLHCGGSWDLRGGLISTKQESASFSGGTKVSMVLNFDQQTFDMYVDGVHKLCVNNIEAHKPLHAYVCMDGSGESFELVSATRQTQNIRCKTQLEAVRLVGNQVIQLQIGLLASNTSSDRPEDYCMRVLSRFCSQIEALKSDIVAGRLSIDAAVRSISRSPSQLAFESVFALACQLCHSSVLGGNFSIITHVIACTHGLRTALRLDESHWLNHFIYALASILGPEVASIIWGKPLTGGSDGDAVAEDWLKSPLFSKGLLHGPSHTNLLVEVGISSPFDGMVQPRVAVHASPYLDRLESDVIIAVLYHIGVIDQAILVSNETSEEMIATCQVCLFWVCCYVSSLTYKSTECCRGCATDTEACDGSPKSGKSDSC